MEQAISLRDKPRRRGLSRKGSEQVFVACVLVIPVLQFILFWIVPNFNSILMAFELEDDLGQVYFTFANFTRFWDSLKDIESGLVYAIVNTLVFFLVSTVLVTPFILFLSYGLYKKVPGYKVFRVVFYIPSILGGTVTANLFRYMVNTGGPVEKLLIAMNLPVNEQIGLLSDPHSAFWMIIMYTLWMSIGSNFVLFTGAMQRIPGEIIESAEFDGAGFWREFVQIVIPLIWPTITTLCVYGMAGLFTNYAAVMLLTPNVKEAWMVGWYINRLTISNATGGGENLYYPAAVGLAFTLVGFPMVLGVKKLMEHFFQGVEY